MYGIKAAGEGGYGLLIVCHTAPTGDRQMLAGLAGKAAIPVYQIGTLITPEELIAQAAAASR